MTVDEVIERWRCNRPDCDDPQCRSMNVLIGEIERLRGIVARLPKTADGVPVTPGMRVYIPITDAIMQCHVIRQAIIGSGVGPVAIGPNELFSTREAAEAAKDIQ